MICKKDVIIWFKELESYKRIDTMCTLLSMCLPFELRFLGTCLEELGRRDSQELRGIELRVNNAQDLATDMVACQKGEPTDMKIRRKMALYLALIRACNRTCNTSTEIFRTLDVWGDRDFENMTDMDTLQELLLVYTMAANHPVFTFEQHRRCIEIFERIKNNKLVFDSEASSNTLLSSPPPPQTQLAALPMVQLDNMSTSPLPAVSTSASQHELRQTMASLSSQQEMHSLHGVHLSGHHPQLISCPPPIQVFSQGSMPINFPQHQISVDGIQHMNLPNIIPVDSNAILTHTNQPWPQRPYPPPPPSIQQQIEHPPQSSSPMLSQQSSPSSSRTTSPSRVLSSNILQQGMQQQTRNTMSQRLSSSSSKNVRRPSAETTPPPIAQIINEISLPPPQNLKNADDVGITNESSGNQLQTLIRNGYTRGAHTPRLKSNFIPSQNYQPMPAASFNTTGITYSMQNTSLSDGFSGNVQIIDSGMVGVNSNKSTGSESSSSVGSSGEISPPETPTILQTNTSNAASRMNSNDQQQQHPKHNHNQPVIFKQINLSRLNGGRGEKVGASTASAIIYAPISSTSQTGQAQFSDIILAPGGNAGSGAAANILQTTSIGSNNNCLGDVSSSSSGGNTSTNNTVSSSSGGVSSTIGLISNVITSNAVMLQPHQPQNVVTQPQQQQYNGTFHYHATQHITTTTRPPPTLMTHNLNGLAPPPTPLPSTFRFPLPPNGDLMYQPAYHPAGIAFLSGANAAPPVTMRSASTASGVISSSNGVGASVTSQLQQIPQQGTALLAVSPYSPISTAAAAATIALKPISCYNCGSQSHTGRECQESSMDDVTRSAVYKLDYSVSSTALTTTTNVTTTSIAISGSTSLENTMAENIHLSATTAAAAAAAAGSGVPLVSVTASLASNSK